MFCVGLSPCGNTVTGRFSKQIADRMFGNNIKVKGRLRKILIRNDGNHNSLISLALLIEGG